MKLRVIGAETIRRLLPWEDGLAAMRQAFIAATDPGTLQPVRTRMDLPDVHGAVFEHGRDSERGIVHIQPGHIENLGLFGLKALAIMRNNWKAGRPTHQGLMVLFEAEHGTPVGILDGGALTSVRTAMATAVATDLLAVKDASSLGLFGYGEQAEAHLEAFLKIRPIKTVKVWGRDRGKAKSFAAAAMKRHEGIEVEPVGFADDVAKSCQILTTVTAATYPYLAGDWLQAGQHINLIGASSATTAEITHEGLRRARVFTDSLENAQALAGELRKGVAARAITWEAVTELGNVLAGRKPGRTGPQDITLFKSLGMAAEDLVPAAEILKRAEAAGEGTLVEM